METIYSELMSPADLKRVARMEMKTSKNKPLAPADFDLLDRFISLGKKKKSFNESPDAKNNEPMDQADLEFSQRLAKGKTGFIDYEFSDTIEVLEEIIPEDCLNSLDELFYGWLGSERASDELSSPQEREQIGYYYRKLKELIGTL